MERSIVFRREEGKMQGFIEEDKSGIEIEGERNDSPVTNNSNSDTATTGSGSTFPSPSASVHDIIEKTKSAMMS